ncbi:hypothetical protein ACJX0J_025972, partial [Zea mays]
MVSLFTLICKPHALYTFELFCLCLSLHFIFNETEKLKYKFSYKHDCNRFFTILYRFTLISLFINRNSQHISSLSLVYYIKAPPTSTTLYNYVLIFFLKKTLQPKNLNSLFDRRYLILYFAHAKEKKAAEAQNREMTSNCRQRGLCHTLVRPIL